MRVERKEINSTTVLAFLGDLTIETAPELFSIMNAAVGDQRCAIVIDLSKVGAIDIAGVATLVYGWRSARGCAGEFSLAGASERIRNILKITKLETAFTIYDTLEQALARHVG